MDTFDIRKYVWDHNTRYLANTCICGFLDILWDLRLVSKGTYLNSIQCDTKLLGGDFEEDV